MNPHRELGLLTLPNVNRKSSDWIALTKNKPDTLSNKQPAITHPHHNKVCSVLAHSSETPSPEGKPLVKPEHKKGETESKTPT